MQRDDLAVIAVVILLGGALAIVSLWVSRRSARSKQRLDLLEESLEHPQLDSQTRNQILTVLAKEHESKLGFLMNGAFWKRLVFGSGWLAFIFCGGMAFLSWMGIVHRHIFNYAIIWALIGLAVASLPFAMREMTTRQVAKP